MINGPFKAHLLDLFATEDTSIVSKNSLRNTVDGEITSVQTIHHDLRIDLSYRVKTTNLENPSNITKMTECPRLVRVKGPTKSMNTFSIG